MAARGQHGVSIEWQRRQLIEKLYLMAKPPMDWSLRYDPEDEDYEPTEEDQKYLRMEEARNAVIAQIDALSPSKARRRAA